MCNMLRIHIRHDLSYKEHNRHRIAKAKRIWQVMTRLGNSNGGMRPQAQRALYTGATGQYSHGGLNSDTDNCKGEVSAIRRVEYQALCKITGAYQGSSHQKLGCITNVQPLEDKNST